MRARFESWYSHEFVAVLVSPSAGRNRNTSHFENLQAQIRLELLSGSSAVSLFAQLEWEAMRSLEAITDSMLLSPEQTPVAIVSLIACVVNMIIAPEHTLLATQLGKALAAHFQIARLTTISKHDFFLAWTHIGANFMDQPVSEESQRTWGNCGASIWTLTESTMWLTRWEQRPARVVTEECPFKLSSLAVPQRKMFELVLQTYIGILERSAVSSSASDVEVVAPALRNLFDTEVLSSCLNITDPTALADFYQIPAAHFHHIVQLWCAWLVMPVKMDAEALRHADSVRLPGVHLHLWWVLLSRLRFEEKAVVPKEAEIGSELSSYESLSKNEYEGIAETLSVPANQKACWVDAWTRAITFSIDFSESLNGVLAEDEEMRRWNLMSVARESNRLETDQAIDTRDYETDELLRGSDESPIHMTAEVPRTHIEASADEVSTQGLQPPGHTADQGKEEVSVDECGVCRAVTWFCGTRTSDC